MTVLLVGLGGAVGAIARYLFGGWLYRLLGTPGFPYDTLVINLMGCFVIGLLNGLAATRGLFTPETRALVFIGLIGGFTTFSTFGYETLALLQDGQTVRAASNIAMHVGFGLLAVWGGYELTQVVGR